MIAAVMAMLIMASVVAVFAAMALAFSASAVAVSFAVVVLAITVPIFARAAAYFVDKFKVYEGVLRIYCHQTNCDSVSYIQPFVAVNDASFSRRPE